MKTSSRESHQIHQLPFDYLVRRVLITSNYYLQFLVLQYSVISKRNCDRRAKKSLDCVRSERCRKSPAGENHGQIELTLFLVTYFECERAHLKTDPHKCTFYLLQVRERVLEHMATTLKLSLDGPRRREAEAT